MRKVVIFGIILFIMVIHGIIVQSDEKIEQKWRESRERSSGPKLIPGPGWPTD